MNIRLREVQSEIERHLLDIDHIEHYIIEKTNLKSSAATETSIKTEGITPTDNTTIDSSQQ